MIPDDNYDEKSDVQIDIPDHSMVVANMSHDDPPAIHHNFIFDEEGQKERLQELVAENRYGIILEFEKGASVKFDAAPDGYTGDITVEDIQNEIECCFDAVEFVYGFSNPDDVFSKFDWR